VEMLLAKLPLPPQILENALQPIRQILKHLSSTLSATGHSRRKVHPVLILGEAFALVKRGNNRLTGKTRLQLKGEQRIGGCSHFGYIEYNASSQWCITAFVRIISRKTLRRFVKSLAG